LGLAGIQPSKPDSEYSGRKVLRTASFLFLEFARFQCIWNLYWCTRMWWQR